MFPNPMTKKPLTDLERIRFAWAMGWSAVIKNQYQDLTVVSIGTDSCTARTENYAVHSLYFRRDKIYFSLPSNQGGEQLREVSITTYKYAGELAGNEPIPEGQKFRVKKTKKLTKELTTLDITAIFHKQEGSRVCLDHLGIGLCWYDKSEIEPYFE